MEINEKTFKDAQIKAGLKELIEDIHQTAKEHGWWDKPQNFSTIVSLIHSELSEALEFERNKSNLERLKIDPLYHYTGQVYSQDVADDYGDINTAISPTTIMSNMQTDVCKKPDGILPELADAVIRIFDYIGHLDMSEEFIQVILEKHDFKKNN
jgi:hypothetical protein